MIFAVLLLLLMAAYAAGKNLLFFKCAFTAKSAQNIFLNIFWCAPFGYLYFIFPL